MEIIDHLEACPRPPDGCIVTIGNFDGVHRGHRSIVERLRSLAEAVDGDAATAVVTFEPHTLEVLRPDAAPQRLTGVDRKLELLAGTDLDYAMVLTFDEERAAQSPEDFVSEILVGCLHARVVLVGEDFRFGHRAAGDVALLRRLGERAGFVVEPLPLVTGPHGEYKSTSVRRAIAAGDMAVATEMLGRPHELRGVVVPGDQRGRTIGFPTANVVPDARSCLPPDGVYATVVRVHDEDGAGGRTAGPPVASVTNLGLRPTFRSSQDAPPVRLVEAHLFDTDRDLYGRTVDVAFVEMLRPERRFDSVDELTAQIAADAAAARALFGATTPESAAP
jgi:riboflavin kinase/FMN adenylyltransferase